MQSCTAKSCCSRQTRSSALPDLDQDDRDPRAADVELHPISSRLLPEKHVPSVLMRRFSKRAAGSSSCRTLAEGAAETGSQAQGKDSTNTPPRRVKPYGRNSNLISIIRARETGRGKIQVVEVSDFFGAMRCRYWRTMWATSNPSCLCSSWRSKEIISCLARHSAALHGNIVCIMSLLNALAAYGASHVALTIHVGSVVHAPHEFPRCV